MKRIISIDIYRGWGMVFVVMFHGIVFNLYGNTTNAGENLSVGILILIIPFVILGTWASLFSFISGIGTTYSVTSRLIEDEKYRIKSRLNKSFIRSFFLIILHFIWCLLFSTPEESITNQTTQGMISLWMRTGVFRFPHASTFFRTSAFSMLAFAELLLGTTLYLIYRNNGYKKIRRNKFVLLFIGFIFIIFGEALYKLFNPIIIKQYLKGNYGISLVLTWLFNGDKAAFPDAGYAFFGAYLGLMKANGERQEDITRKGAYLGWALIFTGISLMIVFGIPLISAEATYSMGLYTFNLGIQFLIGAWAMGLDFMPMDERRLNRKALQWGQNSRRWSLISLTLFMFEQPISLTLALIFRIAVPGSMDNPFFVVFVYGPSYLYLLVKLILLWERHQFKYSIEWFLSGLGKDLSQYDDPLHINDVVYLPGYKKRDFITGEIIPLKMGEIDANVCPFETGDEYIRVNAFWPSKIRFMDKKA